MADGTFGVTSAPDGLLSSPRGSTEGRSKREILLSLFIALAWLVAIAESSNAPASRFLVLSSQRSGSTWLCSQIDSSLAGHYCGAGSNNSLMIEAYMNSTQAQLRAVGGELKVHRLGPLNQEMMRALKGISWANESSAGSVARQAENAYSTLGRLYPQARALGFKLMYNHVGEPACRLGRPSANRTSNVVWVMPLVKFLQQRGVRVIHLVRETAVLQLASQLAGRHSTTDKPVTFTAKDLATVRALEDEAGCWHELLSAHLAARQYQRITYESLLPGDSMTVFLQRSCEWIGAGGTDLSICRMVASRNTTVVLHASGCQARIANWHQISNQLNGSTSVQACARLDAQHQADDAPRAYAHNASAFPHPPPPPTG